jgi:hypothetical protein
MTFVKQTYSKEKHIICISRSYIAKMTDCTDKKMARDKNLRPCLPLKPQEKKLLYIEYRIICLNTTYRQADQKKIGREWGVFSNIRKMQCALAGHKNRKIFDKYIKNIYYFFDIVISLSANW